MPTPYYVTSRTCARWRSFSMYIRYGFDLVFIVYVFMVHKWHQTKPKYNQMFMIIEIIEKSLGWRTFIHRGYQIIWSKGQNNENINKNQCILKPRSPGSIYTGIIKNTLLVQKYWQLISTKHLWSVRNIVSSKSRTVQYRDVQVSTEMSRYRVVQVPRCLGFDKIIPGRSENESPLSDS